jgi:nucleotide-binding universal stress UspA family protein
MSLDFKRILCPVDLSTFSLEAVKLGVEVAENSNASLYLLHVIDNPFDELYMTPITGTDPASLGLYSREPGKRAEIMESTIDHSKVLLKQFCHECVEHLPKVRYIIATGDPFEKIIDAAEDEKIDLIVIATHGRTGIRRLVIGNVAEKVVRHAPCPVLTVKPRVMRRKAKSGGAQSR